MRERGRERLSIYLINEELSAEELVEQGGLVPVKTEAVSRVLQLLDKDWGYEKAVTKVSREDNIPLDQLVNQLSYYV